MLYDASPKRALRDERVNVCNMARAVHPPGAGGGPPSGPAVRRPTIRVRALLS
jgi:hypothetical protein